jgi:hypothetical protein
MAGFSPVGSRPVASVPAGTGGIIVDPATGHLLMRTGGGAGPFPPTNYNVTVGHLSTSSPNEDFWGWSSILVFGSINSTIMPDGTSTILGIYWEHNHTSDTRTLRLVVSGVVANSGWETITVDGHDHLRTDATFDTSTGNTIWSWSSTDNFDTTVGAVKVVTISGAVPPIVNFNGVDASKIETSLWLDPPTGVSASKIETVLWMDTARLEASKIETVLWMDLPLSDQPCTSILW